MLVKRTNYRPVFSSVFDDFFGADAWNNKLATQKPAVNIKEDETSYSLEVAIPGVKKEEVNIDLNKHVLTISSEHKEEKSEEKDEYSKREFAYSSFSRSFVLPEQVKEEEISARHENGIVYISIPKDNTTIRKSIELQ